MITVNFRYIKSYQPIAILLFQGQKRWAKGHCGPSSTPLHCNPHKPSVLVAARGHGDPHKQLQPFEPGFSKITVIGALSEGQNRTPMMLSSASGRGKARPPSMPDLRQR